MLGKKDKLLKFFKLVKDGKFTLNNIAFELFLDIVEWFDKDESPQMRYYQPESYLVVASFGLCLAQKMKVTF